MKFRLILTGIAVAVLAIVFIVEESNSPSTSTPPADAGGITINQ